MSRQIKKNDKFICRWAKFLFKRLVVLVFAGIFVGCTMFGWRLSKPYTVLLTEEKQQTGARLKKIVQLMAGDIGVRNYMSYQNLNKTADYITQNFEKLGYVTRIVSYEVNGQIFKNIVAEKEKVQNPSAEIIIIGAHYDSCFNPGADDNASAVAGMIELARLLKNQELKRSVQFVAFTNEEPPFFMTENMGSRVYARMIKKERWNLKTAIILEMIGYYSEVRNSQRYLPLLGLFYPNRANFIAVVGNFKSHNILGKIVSGFKASSSFPIESIVSPSFVPGINFSDHWSFWKEGYPAVMITDTAYLRNKNYHEPSDLPDTLDYEKMAEMIHGLKESLVQFINE